MILNNTQNTFYSIGNPLWLSDSSTAVNTGILQGISMGCSGPYGRVKLSEYQVSGNSVSMVFSYVSAEGAQEMLCYFSGRVDSTTHVYRLMGVSNKFLSGYVVLLDPTTNTSYDLSGAFVNPLYVSWTNAYTHTEPKLELVYETVVPNSVGPNTVVVSVYKTIPINELAATSTGTVTVAVSGGTAVYTASNTTTQGGVVDQTTIRYINGEPVTSGAATITLPEGWLVSGNNACAELYGWSSGTCPTSNLIAQTFVPEGRAYGRPIDLAYGLGERPYPYVISSGGAAPFAPTNSGGLISAEDFDVNLVYTHRFNTEYENVSGSSPGLAWDELSVLHGDTTSGATQLLNEVLNGDDNA